MTILSVGDRVSGNGIGSGTYYEGILLAFPRPGRKSHRILVKKARELKTGSAAPGSYASVVNVKKLEDNQVSRELVGPKPKPLEEPEHPTPWSYTGNLILDANGKRITRLAKGDPYNSLSLVKAELLAKVIVEAINEKYKVEDAPTPW